MNDHQGRTAALFQEGYNCAQAVFAAYSEELGIPFKDAMKLASSFGGGMGRLREVCGAVSGMLMAAGMKYGYSDPDDKKAKEEHYRLVQTLAKRFEQKNGSIICRELLGLDPQRDDPVPKERSGSYYQKRPCGELVRCAAEILDDCLNQSERTGAASDVAGKEGMEDEVGDSIGRR